MPNLGEKIMLVKTPSGTIKAMRNDVVDCTGPLTAVSQMVDAGNFVGFCKEGSFCLNLDTLDFDLIDRVDDTVCFPNGSDNVQ